MRVGVKMRRKMARCNVNNVFEIRSPLPRCVDAFSFVSFYTAIEKSNGKNIFPLEFFLKLSIFYSNIRKFLYFKL